MQLFGGLYDKVLKLANHPRAPWWLGLISFSESSFFPIPPDVLLLPMAFAQPAKAIRFAALTTLLSVSGGAFGYLAGVFLYDSVALPLIEYYHQQAAFEQVQQWFRERGVIVVLIAGFTPIPYKLFTIAAGVAGMAFIPFMLASAVGRGSRFFLLAILVKVTGQRFENQIREKIDLIGWITISIIIAVGCYFWLRNS